MMSAPTSECAYNKVLSKISYKINMANISALDWLKICTYRLGKVTITSNFSKSAQSAIVVEMRWKVEQSIVNKCNFSQMTTTGSLCSLSTLAPSLLISSLSSSRWQWSGLLVVITTPNGAEGLIAPHTYTWTKTSYRNYIHPNIFFVWTITFLLVTSYCVWSQMYWWGAFRPPPPSPTHPRVVPSSFLSF